MRSDLLGEVEFVCMRRCIHVWVCMCAHRCAYVCICVDMSVCVCAQPSGFMGTLLQGQVPACRQAVLVACGTAAEAGAV